jgi:hypothetical protein
VEAHVDALVRHLPGQTNPLDVVIATRHPEGASPPQPGIALVTSTAPDASRPQIVEDDVVRDDHPLRHDPDKLAVVLMRVLKTEGQRRKGSMNGTLHATR